MVSDKSGEYKPLCLWLTEDMLFDRHYKILKKLHYDSLIILDNFNVLPKDDSFFREFEQNDCHAADKKCGVFLQKFPAFFQFIFTSYKFFRNGGQAAAGTVLPSVPFRKGKYTGNKANHTNRTQPYYII